MRNKGDTADQNQLVRCAIYERVSTDEKLNKDYTSLDVQRERCLRLIESKAHKGFVALRQSYEDPGFSASTMERPGFKKLMEHVRRGQVDCIVVYRLDRFCRSVRDLLNVLEVLREHNVHFISTCEEIDTSTANGKLVLNLLASVAQFESDISSERIQHKIAAAKAHGKYTGGRRVLGYDVDNRRLVVNDAEAGIVRLIYRRYVEHGSVQKIVDELIAEGHPTKRWVNASGRNIECKQWNKHTVDRILTNPLYVGMVNYAKIDQLFKGEHEAIISQQVWEQAQSRRKLSGPEKSGRNRRKLAGFLRGLLVCTKCASTMRPTYTAKGGKRFVYYICNGRAKGGHLPCTMPLLPAKEIEGAVFGQLKAVFRTPEVYEGVLRAAHKELEGRMGDCQGKLSRALNAVEELQRELESFQRNASTESGQGILENIALELRRNQERVQEYSQELDDLRSLRIREQSVFKLLRSMDEMWGLLEPAQQLEIAEMLIEKVLPFDDDLQIHLRVAGLQDLQRQLAN